MDQPEHEQNKQYSKIDNCGLEFNERINQI